MADTIEQQVSEINQQLEMLSISIQTLVTLMSDMLVNGLGPALSGIIPNMQELVNQAVIIQQTLANMWDASQASVFWDKLSMGIDVVGGVASAVTTLKEASTEYAAVQTLLIALSNSAILAWAKESAAMVVTTAATWAQQAATVALNVVQAILNGRDCGVFAPCKKCIVNIA